MEEDHLAYGSDHESASVNDDVDLLKRVHHLVNQFVGQQDENVEGLDYSPSPSRDPQDREGGAGAEHLASLLHLGRQHVTKSAEATRPLLEQISASLKKIGGSFRSQPDSSSSQTVADATLKKNRFDSFAPTRQGNQAKWYVDGCSYFWAVSEALEQAKDSVWILDWWLSPELYFRRPPAENEQYRLDRMLKAAAERGVHINVIVYKEVPQALTLDSAYTKKTLEALHPNIRVFRHPDHAPNIKIAESMLTTELKGKKLNAASASQVSEDALKALYGVKEDTVLYWAHHEKLCLIDGRIAFMGGLDLCYGRWDTHQHSIADVHPANVRATVFVGQDYNNARIMDFQGVSDWKDNKLDRTTNSRIGWSDVSVCLQGPSVRDLEVHFTQRWNFIYGEKYSDNRAYTALSLSSMADEEAEPKQNFGHDNSVRCQILRSCSRWSHGSTLEHSIQNAYLVSIEQAENFIYIENQFFITATGSHQKPVMNEIGAALVQRITKAAESAQPFKVYVVIPAIPGFSGDLRSDESASTRAIMQYQYWSINRGGNSIYECLERKGIDPKEYITFYNLRNYDRIHSDATVKKAEQQSGVKYTQAQQDLDQALLRGAGDTFTSDRLEAYQQSAQKLSGKKLEGKSGESWDTVAECYMLGGKDIREVPWDEGELAELDAFVSEELYVHTKVMIVDDRRVICGSANLNDRSQLGSHDSEIAVLVEDTDMISSRMAGEEYIVSKFATSLRRQLMRKHLGLLTVQDMRRPDENSAPVGIPNEYDWNSREDTLVQDPLSQEFQSLWKSTARINTEVFTKVFHVVPFDGVRDWKQYQEYYERFFHEDTKRAKRLSEWKWGHVVAENFKTVTDVKEELSKIKGMLVEMPLDFLKDEEIAKTGIALNHFTEVVYT